MGILAICVDPLKMILQPTQALQIDIFIGSITVALRLPDAFGQAFRHAMFDLMRIGVTLHEILVNPADSDGAVGGQLFLNGDMQSHVQEWVGFTRFRKIVTIFARVSIGQGSVVFRMRLYDPGDQDFNTFEW